MLVIIENHEKGQIGALKTGNNFIHKVQHSMSEQPGSINCKVESS